MSGHWTVIQIEGYCMRGTNIRLSEFLYSLDGKKVENSSYDPTYVDPPAPEWCPGDPCYECLCRECVHFAYCEHDGSDCND